MVSSAQRLARFRRDAGGIAAIEFAMILPLLITLYFGLTELVRAIDTGRKTTLYARTIADLSGRATNGSPTTTDMAAIVNAAGSIMRPYPTTNVQVAIHAMGVESISGGLYGGVCSSYPQNARPVLTLNGNSGLPATPATFQYDGARYVLAEVTVSYAPIIGSKLYQSIFGARGLVFSRQISWAQRLDKGEVVMPGGSKCPTY
ncbi:MULTISPECIES: TadE/TadG family type IV pilus assembly protein [unclassified Methylobacterium]|uniref:TadE/TadG family type IV pilus assembly protein n=1 Tax=unclassified Methylobacterium TaxID=2615210 RepID=UPI001FBAE2CF|nr:MULTISPECIES: TadE/TadG family type IV pilus assembly protein [unclassified Methylobacterium]MCJ2093887.1 pilus assembly protein [Methylobacterium sp. J-072]MCJ2141790.1 pilus assembly protein [Methylobacterium sp. E-066]